MFASLVTGKQIELNMKNINICTPVIEHKEDNIRKILFIFYLIAITIMFILFRYTQVLDYITNS